MEKDDIPAHVAALGKAITIAGSQEGLAERMRTFGGASAAVSQQQISYWLKYGTLIAAEYWPGIESATEYGVTRRDLRPDVFAPSHAA